VVADEEPGRGPLGGICAALAATSAPQAVFLPVDMPFVPSSLILYQMGHAAVTGAAVTLFTLNGAVQPFPVVLGRRTLPVLKALLDAGRGSCLGGFEAAAAHFGERLALLPVEALVQSGQVVHPGGLPAALWFLNVNTPEGLRWAGRVHEWLHPVS
jgi:molybdopterin-guanine dinucleotide biosynthesis protein A